ncbi:hypothetical protein P152DRAFT_481217 [Eremomyces bilateralis CBS 781.70]|uniref:UBA domain-containing protein n=1 Tax=Eremomyces bilateralis CBS 781.70 TaxID=1392243 RepID=A0A6G1G813_9PEZI|nr:uncharacterized protein P152DRAFT_481217 [Eremomyces bilateralis CBS 781.70]KAF1814061.1 hypothetical protein P152DRAFT_481217 [Eremomyces bilateralis CBS 781.70]
MDDLAGLDWSSSKPSSNTNPPSQQTALSFPSLKPTPSPSSSGRSTPFSLPSSNTGNHTPKLKVQPRSSTPATDSFAGLLSLNSSKPAAAQLSLQEQQRRLQEEKRRKDEEQSKLFGAQFGGQEKFWDTLGSRTTGAPKVAPQKPQEEEDDILAAFKSTAPVDASSHFPPPKGTSPPPIQSSEHGSRGTSDQRSRPAISVSDPMAFNDDDDPFGLGQMSQKPPAATPQPATTDDDILGMLGRPVSEMPPPQRSETKPVDDSSDDDGPLGMDPKDRAVAELVDMGFDASKAADALEETENGTNVQAAVGILLTRAHEESKQKTGGGEKGSGRSTPQQPEPRQSKGRQERDDSGVPPWMRSETQRGSSGSRDRDEAGHDQEKDVAQYASEIGSTFLKSANSFWKTGQKKMQKAVAEFQQEGDPSQPRWMREAQSAQRMPESRPTAPRGRATNSSKEHATNGKVDSGVTDEAMMLEAGSARPSKERQEALPHRPARANASRSPWDEPDRNPFSRPNSSQPERQAPTGKLTREQVDEQTATAYVSPARRKKATPVPEPDRRPSPLSNASKPSSPPASLQSKNPFAQQTSSARPAPPPRRPSTPPRPKAPPRQIPPVSPSALTTSTTHRTTGTASFKRGDYASAHTSFTSALAPLPRTHPITILVLCNRATTALKIGDPKSALADADSALALIGPARGVAEHIDLPPDAPGAAPSRKDMRDFWARATMRKAEALENLEKWKDAADAWRIAVEAGVGGSVSIQGRNRCDHAIGGGSSTTSAPSSGTATKRPTPRPQPIPKPKPAMSAMDALAGRPAPSHASSAEAVQKLRDANRAAERLEDEKFALVDAVEGRLVAWKGSRAENLRALLGSLEGVLWEGAGWRKVGMGELVVPGRVKVVYMKAIAKVHPDKIPQDATTEQKMISAAVFSTLNEAWDKFKKDNGL